MRTIAVTNQKGGVGKTTTVANLGAALAERGVKVCLIDMDPQTHLTMHFGVDPAGLSCSMYDVLTADLPLSRAAMAIGDNLTVVPSAIDLAAAEVELAGAVGREQILADRIAAESPPFDLIMVDCPPSLSLLTLNALAAAREALIPLQPHFLALQGLGKLLETVALVQRRINPALKVSGVVFCLYETSTRLAAEVIEDVETFFADARHAGRPAWAATRIYRTRIRRNIKLAECPSYGTTIHKYDPSSRGAADYASLCEEFLAAWPDAPVRARVEAEPAEPAQARAPQAEAAPAADEAAPAAPPESAAEGAAAAAAEVATTGTPLQTRTRPFEPAGSEAQTQAEDPPGIVLVERPPDTPPAETAPARPWPPAEPPASSTGAESGEPPPPPPAAAP